MAGGGEKIQVVRGKYTILLLQKLIKLASLQTSFSTLDEAIKVTNCRVNALENVTIPKIQGMLDYIDHELDELERDDFTCLKLMQSKKEALNEVQRKEIETEMKERISKGLKVSKLNEGDITSNSDAGDDVDVVF